MVEDNTEITTVNVYQNRRCLVKSPQFMEQYFNRIQNPMLKNVPPICRAEFIRPNTKLVE